MALDSHMEYATQNDVAIESSFPDVVTMLISNRPLELSQAFKHFSEMMALAIRTLTSAVKKLAKVATSNHKTVPSLVMRLEADGSPTIVSFPVDLLLAVAVVLSLWVSGNGCDLIQQDVNDVADVLLGKVVEEEDDASVVAFGLAGAEPSDENVTPPVEPVRWPSLFPLIT